METVGFIFKFLEKSVYDGILPLLKNFRNENSVEKLQMKILIR